MSEALSSKLQMEILLTRRDYYLASNRIAEHNNSAPLYVSELLDVEEGLKKILGGLK